MSNSIPEKAQAILNERFGCDQLLSLATLDGDWPAVRTVNGYYEDGCFFVITYGLSNKMKQIEKNPHVALSGEWFTAQGIGENLGWFNRDENADYARRLREVFASWIDNGPQRFFRSKHLYSADSLDKSRAVFPWNTVRSGFYGGIK